MVIGYVQKGFAANEKQHMHIMSILDSHTKMLRDLDKARIMGVARMDRLEDKIAKNT